MVVGMSIGVLALQGAFVKHEQMLKELGVQHLQVRYPHELARCDGLIIPGGESTTMTYQIQELNFLDPLKEFAKDHPIFGTCAGMILMAREGILSLLDISITRNAYGRQCASFLVDLHGIPALFIRAPRISKIYSAKVAVLMKHADEPVLIQQGLHLASAFHPELTKDLRIHKYFTKLCKIKLSPLQQSKIILTKSFQSI